MTLNVYYGCSMRGGYPNVCFDDLAEIARVIEKLGFHLESRHQTSVDYIEHDKRRHDNIIHDKDYTWLKEADFGVFEISNPSLGTGAEISDMIHMGKPVLCLYRREFKDKVSKYITGKHGSHHVLTKMECYEYHSIGEAMFAIKKFASEIKKN